MARITIKYETNFVSEDTGYSAWVHMTNGGDAGFAHHAGYYAAERVATISGKHCAESFARVLTMAGKKPIVKEGAHT